MTSSTMGSSWQVTGGPVHGGHGSAVADTVARRLVVPSHRAGGQAQFVAAPVPDRDDHPLAALLPWTTARLDQPLTVDGLARRAGMSTRPFHRTLGVAPDA
ncbi:hypothetical protein ACIPPJ_31930 [Streptomyces sp. NPDC086091]|uniref:hypothetical protein n=1 Tax=Streptomyces sp. NPDC086091 TaxID=3365751 RepID=UPI0037F82AB2